MEGKGGEGKGGEEREGEGRSTCLPPRFEGREREGRGRGEGGKERGEEGKEKGRKKGKGRRKGKGGERDLAPLEKNPGPATVTRPNHIITERERQVTAAS